MKSLLPAVFLVRDGILNERVFDDARRRFVPPRHPGQVSLRRRSGSFLRGLNGMGFRCLAIATENATTGQLSPIRRDRINRRLRAELGEQGARVHGIYSCPFDRSLTSKAIALAEVILDAAATHRIEMHRSLLVANDIESVIAGSSAGLATIWVADSEERAIEEFAKFPDGRPTNLVGSLDEALAIIREDSRASIIRPT